MNLDKASGPIAIVALAVLLLAPVFASEHRANLVVPITLVVILGLIFFGSRIIGCLVGAITGIALIGWNLTLRHMERDD